MSQSVNQATIDTKKRLREEYQQLRTRFSGRHGAGASEAIALTVQHLPAFWRATTVMVYTPFRSEVNTWGLTEAVQNTGRKLVLPKTVPDQHRLVLALVTDTRFQLAPGNYGIIEPVLDSVEEIELDEVDLVLVPGLAFDLHGFRVGYGGGYYDRLLRGADRQKTHFMGLAFDFQVKDVVPVSQHDQRLDGIITERRVIFARSRNLDA